MEAMSTPIRDEDWVTEPDFRGSGVSRRRWEQDIVEMAAAGDETAQSYVDGHAHLPEHPGLNVWTGSRWEPCF